MKHGVWTALMCWSALVALFGLGLAGAAFTATDGFADFAFGQLRSETVAWTPSLRFAVALMGAVTFGWALTFAAIASFGRRVRADLGAALLRRTVGAVAIWFGLDSALSIATGFGLNAVSNAILFVAFLGIALRGGAFNRKAAHPT